MTNHFLPSRRQALVALAATGTTLVGPATRAQTLTKAITFGATNAVARGRRIGLKIWTDADWMAYDSWGVTWERHPYADHTQFKRFGIAEAMAYSPPGAGTEKEIYLAFENHHRDDHNIRVRLLCRTSASKRYVRVGNSITLENDQTTPSDPTHGSEIALNVYLPSFYRDDVQISKKEVLYRTSGGAWARADKTVPSKFVDAHPDERDASYQWLTAQVTNKVGRRIEVMAVVTIDTDNLPT